MQAQGRPHSEEDSISVAEIGFARSLEIWTSAASRDTLGLRVCYRP
jgi:hypothetical protein